MNKTTIVTVIIVLIIGSGSGYFIGKNSVSPQGDSTELQDAISMMKDQSTSIKQMSNMMKQGGMTLQDAGIKYEDDNLVQKGKDMQVIGEKYLDKDESDTNESGMDKMMAQ